MEIRAEQLRSQLQQSLKFSYVLVGEETLLLLEAADLIREAARAKGFIERHVFEVNAQLDWTDVRYEAQAMGLFASQKLIELRLSAPKIDSEGVELLEQWRKQPPEGVMVLLTLNEWKKDYAKQVWFTALDALGAHCIFWPIKREELPGWLEARARALKLSLDPDAALALADRVEGNLLAAKQALDQIQLQRLAQLADSAAESGLPLGNEAGPAPRVVGISAEDIEAWVADSAHFSVSSLVDSVLLGEVARAVRILRSLIQEGEEAFMIASALIRQIELMHELASARSQGGPDAVKRLYPVRGVWPARQRIYDRALARADAQAWHQRVVESANVDQIIKGRRFGNGWLALERLMLRCALTPAKAAAFSELVE